MTSRTTYWLVVTELLPLIDALLIVGGGEPIGKVTEVTDLGVLTGTVRV